MTFFWVKIIKKMSGNFFLIYFAFLESTSHDPRKFANKKFIFLPPPSETTVRWSELTNGSWPLVRYLARTLIVHVA